MALGDPDGVACSSYAWASWGTAVLCPYVSAAHVSVWIRDNLDVNFALARAVKLA